MKKYFACILLMLIIAFECITAFAWKPSTSFICCIDANNIPQNTAYIDLLLPIGESDKGYTEYNSKNGELYSLPENSQIIQYYEEGFASCTFHLDYSVSQLVPEEGEYDDNVLRTFYEVDSGGRYDIEKFKLFCRKYEKAKLAYIDSEGNILAVSNAARIYNGKEPFALDMNLTGTNLTIEINDTEESSRLLAKITLIFIAFICAFVAVIVIFLVIGVIKLISHRKNSKKF